MISRDEVEKIAHLARLTLADDEAVRFTKELNAILEYVRVIASLDIEGLKPTAHAVEVENVFRPEGDAPRAGGITEAVLRRAPAADGDYFLVPKVL